MVNIRQGDDEDPLDQSSGLWSTVGWESLLTYEGYEVADTLRYNLNNNSAMENAEVSDRTLTQDRERSSTTVLSLVVYKRK